MRLFLSVLLTFFLFGCGEPKERTVWITANQGVPAGLVPVRLNKCCGSMKAAIQGGELAWAEPYKGQSDLVGYIVVVKDKFTHRVTAENSRAVYTSGDANKYSDGWVQKSEIQYIIKYIVRK